MIAAALAAGCSGEKAASPAADAGAAGCARDSSVSAATAATLTQGAAAAGHLCPLGDTDWYAFDTGAQNGLVTLTLAMDAPLSSVEPTYTVWTRNADGTAGEVVVPPPAAKTGVPLEGTYCVAPGSYLVAVSDYADDAEDGRHAYALTATAAKDPDVNEPNDAADAFTAVPPEGGAFSGCISCAGDRDFFGIPVTGRKILSVGLTAGPGRVAFAAAVLDEAGVTLGAIARDTVGVAATDLHRRVVLPAAGLYFVVVTGGVTGLADPALPYALTIGVEDDGDLNEPNDHPSTATPLGGGGAACADEWSTALEATGTIGVIGDADWFRLPITGCVRGLVEATVTLDTSGLDDAAAWELQRKVQAAISVVRAHDASPCDGDDGACRLLTRPCRTGWDCSGLFSTCQAEGFCGGATVCLPEKACGATLVEDHYPVAQVPSPIPGPPPQDTAVVTAPFYDIALLYLKVSDYQGDGEDPAVPYTLRVRVRNDPDLNEPNNPFLAPDLLQSTEVAPQQAKAVAIPVHDCAAGDCCGDGTWIEGAVSYRNDVDWFTYAHPCPGRDCMLRISYQLDAGPVDFLFSVHHGETLWFDTVVPTVELPAQPAAAGSYGGLSPADACFYAYQGHKGTKECRAGERCINDQCLTPAGSCAVDGDCQAGEICHGAVCVASSAACEADDGCQEGERCYDLHCVASSGGCRLPYYFVSVRDLAVVRDQDADQRYRFCVEKAADGCHGGGTCAAGQCVEAYASCATDADCPPAERCVESACVQSTGPCETSAECAGGTACIVKNCVTTQGACGTDGDCATGPCTLYYNGCGTSKQ